MAFVKIPESTIQVKLVELTDNCIDKIADAVVRKLANRKTENCSEKPNNCKDEARIITDGTYLYAYDKMFGEWRPIQDISGHKQTERSSE